MLRAQKQPPGPTLFLGNLGFETTEASIRELFEAHRYWGRKGREKEKGAEEQEVDGGEGEGKDGSAKSKDVWIRKIRMGTFEDSGACKGSVSHLVILTRRALTLCMRRGIGSLLSTLRASSMLPRHSSTLEIIA